ncbi:MAG: hypothetical protein AAF600_19125, partial [Bacteroidota bacterium]
KAFQKLNNMIVENVKLSDEEFMVRYLRMSPYVDGYFAEAYFDNIIFLTANNQELFCSSYKRLNDDEQRRLKTYSDPCQ